MVSMTRSVTSPYDALFARLVEARCQTDDLFSLVRREALFDRPIPERHRLIFYLGHLEAFDWNLIARESLAVEPFHPEFDKLFAFGIDPTGDGLPTDLPGDWPSEDEVRRYDARVRSTLDGLLGQIDATLLSVAIEHRLMHAETLTYLLHQLPLDRKIARHFKDRVSAANRRAPDRDPCGKRNSWAKSRRGAHSAGTTSSRPCASMFPSFVSQLSQ